MVDHWNRKIEFLECMIRTLQQQSFQIPKSTLLIKMKNNTCNGSRLIVNSGAAKASATHNMGIAINHIVQKWIAKIESEKNILQGRLLVGKSISCLVNQLHRIHLSPISTYVLFTTDVASFYNYIKRQDVMKHLDSLDAIVESPIDVKFLQLLIYSVIELEVFEQPMLREKAVPKFFRRLHGLSTGTNYAPAISKLFYLADELRILESFSLEQLPSYTRIVSWPDGPRHTIVLWKTLFLQIDDIFAIVRADALPAFMDRVDKMIPLDQRKHTFSSRRITTLGITVRITRTNQIKCGVHMKRFLSKGIQHADSNTAFVRKEKSIKNKIQHSINVSSTQRQHDHAVKQLRRTLRMHYGYSKKVP